MPRLVRQMLLLSRREVDVAALGVGQGVELGGLGGVVVNLDVVQRHAGQRFDAGFEVVRQTSVIGAGLAICFAWLSLRGLGFCLDQFLFLRLLDELGNAVGNFLLN